MDSLPIHSFQWTLLENISQFCLAMFNNLRCLITDETISLLFIFEK